MSKRAPTTSTRYRALLQLLRTADVVWNTSRQFFAPWDLSPSQFNVLNLLTGNSGLSQVELSRQLIMHRSNVTGLVDRLEKRGFVSRLETPNDRRAYRVALTTEGERVMKEILPLYFAGAEQLWGSASEKDLKQVVAHLEAAAANAERIARETPLNQRASHENNPNKDT